MTAGGTLASSGQGHARGKDGPATLAVRRAVGADLADLPPRSLVLVACSGGADSLALAAATAWVGERSAKRALADGAPVQHLRTGAIVVDHGIRPDSADVAASAAAACRGLGLDPVRTVRVRVAAGRGSSDDGAGDWQESARSGPERAGSGPEGAAREARYAALADVAAELGADAVLLGHTLDDQAESVLLALARGAGASAVSGMPPRRGLLRRPLLGVRRAQTWASCAELGLRPDVDPGNAVDGPWRTAAGEPLRRAAVRERALPALAEALGQDPAPALARTAARARADEDLLGALAVELLDAARRPAPGGAPAGTLALDVLTLREAPEALLGRALHAALLTCGGSAASISHRHVDALVLLLRARGRGPADLPGATARRWTGSGQDGAIDLLLLRSRSR